MSVIIVGANGLGREVAWLCRRNDYKVEGYLDDNTSLHGTLINGVSVLGAVNEARNFKDFRFIIAIADPDTRSRIVETLIVEGVTDFPNIIDKDAIVGVENSIGKGSVIFPGAIVTVNCDIGDFSIINKNCSVGHDARLGDFCTLAPLAMLGGHVVLENKVEIGAAACVKQSIRIAASARVGMGGVVVKSVPENQTVVGNPAKSLN